MRRINNHLSSLFSLGFRPLFSLMALVSLGAHAWVGIWGILTDYFTERLMGQTGNVLRLVLQLACGVTMFTYMVWGIQILWGY